MRLDEMKLGEEVVEIGLATVDPKVLEELKAAWQDLCSRKLDLFLREQDLRSREATLRVRQAGSSSRLMSRPRKQRNRRLRDV